MARAKKTGEKVGPTEGASPAETGPLPPATGTEGAQTDVAGTSIPAAEAKTERTARTVPEGWTVVVFGPPKGRWRIGRHFGPEPVVFASSDLTEAQFAALQGDPELKVSVEPPV